MSKKVYVVTKKNIDAFNRGAVPTHAVLCLDSIKQFALDVYKDPEARGIQDTINAWGPYADGVVRPLVLDNPYARYLCAKPRTFGKRNENGYLCGVDIAIANFFPAKVLGIVRPRPRKGGKAPQKDVIIYKEVN